MKRGLHIRWPVGNLREYVPPDRTCIVIWKDQFGSVHATGWGPNADADSELFETAVRRVLATLNLNEIIEE